MKNCDCDLTGGCEKCSSLKNNFIGVLEPGEAEKIFEELKIFKKRLNDDLEKKHIELFGKPFYDNN